MDLLRKFFKGLKRKPLLAVALLLLLIDLIIFSPFLFKQGEVLYSDFVFPVNQQQFRDFHYPLLNFANDYSNFSSLYRVISRAPLLLLSYVFSVSTVLKIYIFSTFYLGQLAMLYFLYSRLKVRKISLLFVLSFFYTINLAFLDYCWKTSLVVDFALAPLFIAMVEQWIESRSILNVYLLVLTLMFLLMFVHPYSLLFTLLFCSYWILFIYKKGKWSKKLQHLIILGIFCAVCTSYYLVPFINQVSQSGFVSPETSGFYTFNQSIIDLLSSSSLSSKITLVRDVIFSVDYYPDSPIRGFWYVAGMSLIIALPCLYVLGNIKLKKHFKNNYSWIWLLLIFLLTYFLSFGNNGPLGWFYNWLVNILPENMQWILRSPLKLQLFTWIPLYFIIAQAVIGLDSYVSERSTGKRKWGIYLVSIVFCIFSLIYSGYTFKEYFWGGVLSPLELPDAYKEITSILDKTGDNAKVVYYPAYNDKTVDWAGDRRLLAFEMISSTQPTYSYWRDNTESTKDFFINVISQADPSEYCSYFSGLNINYLVIHNDLDASNTFSTAKIVARLKAYYKDSTLYAKDDWYLFRINCASASTSIKPNITASSFYDDVKDYLQDFNVVSEKNYDNAYLSLSSYINKQKQSDLLAGAVSAGAENADKTNWRLLDGETVSSKLLDSGSPIAVHSYDNRDLLYTTSTEASTASLDQTATHSNNELYFAATTSAKIDQTDSRSFTIKANNDANPGFYSISAVTDIAPASDTLDRILHLDVTLQNITGFHITYILLDKDGNNLAAGENFLASGISTPTTISYSNNFAITLPANAKAIKFNLKGVPQTEAGTIQINSAYTGIPQSGWNKQVFTTTLEDQTSGNYYLVIQYLKSPESGSINIALNSFTKTIATTSATTGWQTLILPVSIATDNDGKIIFNLTNLDGTNVIAKAALINASDISTDAYISLDGNCDFAHSANNVTPQITYCAGSLEQLTSDHYLNLMDYYTSSELKTTLVKVEDYKTYKLTLGTVAQNDPWFSLSLPNIYRALITANGNTTISGNYIGLLLPNDEIKSSTVSLAYTPDYFFQLGIVITMFVLFGLASIFSMQYLESDEKSRRK